LKPGDEPDSGEYEAVRRELVERGYLQGSVERFVLGDVVASPTGLPRVLRTALRGAIVGGPLLGALLAAAAAAANRPLQGPGDLLLLWLYFTPLAALGLLALDLVAAGFVVQLNRRRGARAGDALRAALLVGLPILAYLIAIARTRRPASGWLEEAIFLGLALALSLWVAWVAGLVSVAAMLGSGGGVPPRSRHPVALLLAVLAPLGAGLLLVAVATGDSAAPSDPPPFEVRPAQRLLMIGIDGLDGGLLEVFEPRGVVATLLETMAQGAVFPMSRQENAEPPAVWTTLLTGVSASRHGVRGAGAERLPGIDTPLDGRAGPLPLAAALRFLLPSRTVPTTGAVRRTRTVWEIVGLKRSSLAVGWWASWPATDPDAPAQLGYIVTDRVLPKLLSSARADRDTAPEALFGRLSTDFEADRAAIQQDFESSFVAVAGEPMRGWVRDSHLIDAYALRVARRLGQDEALAAAFVYLPGLEILRHRIGPVTEGLAGAVAAQGALEDYLRWISAEVVDFAEAEPGQLLIVADPGRTSGASVEGFVALSGGVAEARCVGPTLNPMDVAPLVLAISGYPASLEMPGRTPEACLRLATGAPPVESYGKRGPFDEHGADPYDPEMLERLRSLGYLN